MCVVGLAAAHKGATGIVKERMDAMKDISKHMKLMKKMIRGKTSYDGQRFRRAAKIIADHGEEMPKLFPKGSMQKPTRVKNTIWQDWDKFETQAKKLTVHANELASKADKEQDINALNKIFKKLGKTCKSCHKKFRLEKK